MSFYNLVTCIQLSKDDNSLNNSTSDLNLSGLITVEFELRNQESEKE